MGDRRLLERNSSKTTGDRDSVSKDHHRKWHMGYQMVTWSITSRSRDPRRCCEAVRSAILAAAWLHVSC